MNAVVIIGGWGETYPSGRPTGRWLQDCPGDGTRCAYWCSEESYYQAFEYEQHDECHSYSRPDFGCDLCNRAGFNDPTEDDGLLLDEAYQVRLRLGSAGGGQFVVHPIASD